MKKPTDWYSGTRLAVAEGHTKMKAIRCLKRYISCEVYTLLRNQNSRSTASR